MNLEQRMEASSLASSLIVDGHHLTDMVYVLYYPDNSSQAETSIAGLSKPIPCEEHAALKTPLKYVSLGSLLTYIAPSSSASQHRST
jgi:hypothetical protein